MTAQTQTISAPYTPAEHVLTRLIVSAQLHGDLLPLPAALRAELCDIACRFDVFNSSLCFQHGGAPADSDTAVILACELYSRFETEHSRALYERAVEALIEAIMLDW